MFCANGVLVRQLLRKQRMASPRSIGIHIFFSYPCSAGSTIFVFSTPLMKHMSSDNHIIEITVHSAHAAPTPPKERPKRPQSAHSARRAPTSLTESPQHELSGALLGSVALSGALWSSLTLSAAFWHSLELFGNLWSFPALSGAVWSCVGLSGALWGFLELSCGLWRSLAVFVEWAYNARKDICTMWAG